MVSMLDVKTYEIVNRVDPNYVLMDYKGEYKLMRRSALTITPKLGIVTGTRYAMSKLCKEMNESNPGFHLRLNESQMKGN